jgi:GH24 family phage-related lysozyme (muramidase)
MAGQARAAPNDLNADQTISASGVAAIRDGEGLRNGGAHYNDIANNCTVGLGTLVHHGPCTAAELAQPADQQQTTQAWRAGLRMRRPRSAGAWATGN